MRFLTAHNCEGTWLVYDKVSYEVHKHGLTEEQATHLSEALNHQPAFDFTSLYNLYPKKGGKSTGIRRLQSQVKTAEKFERVKAAIVNYKRDCNEKSTEEKFIKRFDHFRNIWRDWEPEVDHMQKVTAPKVNVPL